MIYIRYKNEVYRCIYIYLYVYLSTFSRLYVNSKCIYYRQSLFDTLTLFTYNVSVISNYSKDQIRLSLQGNEVTTHRRKYDIDD